MFNTLPGAPPSKPADGQTLTSPRPARPSMPAESRSRAKIHSTGSASQTWNEIRMALGHRMLGLMALCGFVPASLAPGRVNRHHVIGMFSACEPRGQLGEPSSRDRDDAGN
jgi:hypothetical protein